MENLNFTNQKPQAIQTPAITHPYHLVDVSPWPILMSFALLSGALLAVNWLTLGENNQMVSIIIISNISQVFLLWLRDVVREGKAGYHTEKVRYGLMCGFLIFLLTEILQFASFFWSLFHNSLNPSVELAVWPPLGINAIDYQSLPLLNSLLLLGSGFVATYAHHSFLSGNKVPALVGMLLASVQILIFVFIQGFEYIYSEFTIADSAYGTTFFALTGLHGAHMIVALIFLGVATYRMYLDQITTEHALVLDFSLIYLHLVDVIWLFLYFVLYYWGS